MIILTKPDQGMRLSVFLFLLGSFCLRAGLFRGEGRAGRLCGGSYSFHLLLTDSSFETNQILNKKKQVICLASCSEIQTRSIKNCLSRNVSTLPVLTSLLYQPGGRGEVAIKKGYSGEESSPDEGPGARAPVASLGNDQSFIVKSRLKQVYEGPR